MARRAVCTAGEELAAAWYQQHGYEVLARNWRCRDGEIDLVLRRGRTYVFCEVKARSGASFGLPAEAVTAAKQARLRRLAARFISERVAAPEAPRRVRFDVAAVLGTELEVIEAAF